MGKYRIIEENSCSTHPLGEYSTLEEAEAVAAMLEESGVQVEIQEEKNG